MLLKEDPPMTSKTTAPAAGTPIPEARFTSLRRFNLIMGFLHLIQGILMIVLSNATTYPIYTNFLSFDVATRSLAPNPQLIYELRFGPAVAMFLLISAVAHFYLATIGYPRYVADLKKNMNPIRFYEYALSSSLMIVLIGMLVGLWDLGAIILIFTLNATMNLFGVMMELHNQTTKKTDWTAFIYGCIAGFVPWIVITMYFVGAVNSGDADPGASTHFSGKVQDRQTALVMDQFPFTGGDAGVDNNLKITRTVFGGDIENDDPAQVTHLVGGQTQSRGAVHGGPHVIYELLQLPIDVRDVFSPSLKNRIGKRVNRNTVHKNSRI